MVYITSACVQYMWGYVVCVRLFLLKACCMYPLVHSVLWSHVSHLHHSLQLMAPHQVVTLEGLVEGKEWNTSCMYCLYSIIHTLKLATWAGKAFQLCTTCIHASFTIVKLSSMCISLVINSSSRNTADVPHVTILVIMLPVTPLLLVGTVLHLVNFNVTAFSGSGWLRGRDRIAEPLVWSMATD